MHKLLICGALLTAFVYAAPANAGCWATAGLAPPPAGTAPGEAWIAQVTILQHGRNPLPDAAQARPTVTIRSAATGKKFSFTAVPIDVGRGLYEARVVFPSAGRWSYAVFDSFTSWNGAKAPCARTHTFAPVEIGGGSSAGRASIGGSKASAAAVAPDADGGQFPVWLVVVGGVLVATLIVVAGARGYRRAVSPGS
jgi:hypothetical protein